MRVMIIFTPLLAVMWQLYQGPLTSYLECLLEEIFSTSVRTLSAI